MFAGTPGNSKVEPRKAPGAVDGLARVGILSAMSASDIKVLAVAGTLQKVSATRAVVRQVADLLAARGCSVDLLDFLKEPLALYNPDTTPELDGYGALQARVDQADIIVLGTPDYHGSLSGAMKNFLDHFWHEFAGKLFVTIVASHDKGLTVTDQLRTIARQCYAWNLPYGVSFTQGIDVKDGQIASPSLHQRLEMLARDAHVYGRLIAAQRRADLASAEPSFLSRYRKK